jgi:acyl-ACP thioesterase
MDIYQKEFRIRNADVDMDRKLKLSTRFEMFQEASIAHTELLGAGREKTLDRGLLWVVTMQTASVLRMPEYDDRIVLKSWAGNMMHILFPRYYRIEDAEGGLMAEGSALWGLISADTRKPVFPEQFGIEVPGTVTGTEAPLPTIIRQTDVTNRSDFTVPYSYVDMNGHMNNTRYFDLVRDVLFPLTGGAVPKSVNVEYAKEARLGERISVCSAKTDRGYYVIGCPAEGPEDSLPEKHAKKIFRMSLEF